LDWTKELKPPGLPDRRLNEQEAPWFEEYLGLEPHPAVKSKAGAKTRGGLPLSTESTQWIQL